MARHWLEPGEFKEVVQIGAVKLDADSFAILDEFDMLVRPRINPLLSPYFEKLTGIANAELAARGVDFAEPMRASLALPASGPIAAFGHDEWVLEDNIRLYGMTEHAAAAALLRSARLVRRLRRGSARHAFLRYRPGAGRAVRGPRPQCAG